jgi:hypothetical protein
VSVPCSSSSSACVIANTLGPHGSEWSGSARSASASNGSAQTTSESAARTVTANAARSRTAGKPATMLTVYIRVKVQVYLQADKSPIVDKGPLFPRVVNPRYQIRGTMCDARIDLVKPRNFDLQEVKPMHLILKNIKTNLIY